MKLRFEIFMQKYNDHPPVKLNKTLICHDYYHGKESVVNYINDCYIIGNFKYVAILCYDYENVLVGTEILA